MSAELKPYSYFKAPDGYEVLDKFAYALKPAVLAGFGLSVVDTVCYSHPKGYLATFGRYLYVTSPIVLATATFVTTSNLSGSIRKKDDQLNWFIGGVASGTILGAYYKCYRVGFLSSVFFGLGLLGLKVAHLRNYRILDLENRIVGGGATSHKYDFTLTKERPKNWTTGN